MPMLLMDFAPGKQFGEAALSRRNTSGKPNYTERERVFGHTYITKLNIMA